MIELLSKKSLLAKNKLPIKERGEAELCILQIGIDAFHRALQAVYTDDLLTLSDKNWKITSVISLGEN